MSPKITKNQKIYIFQKVIEIFAKFSTEFVDKNVENIEHGTNWLSIRLFRKNNCCLSNEKSLKLTPKMTKTHNFSFFSFYAIFVRFLTNFADWNVEKRQQGKNFSPVGLFEEFIAVF